MDNLSKIQFPHSLGKFLEKQNFSKKVFFWLNILKVIIIKRHKKFTSGLELLKKSPKYSEFLAFFDHRDGD
jgi:hypothetical protein